MARINKEGHIIYPITVVTKDKGRRIRQSVDRAIIPGHPDYHDQIVWLPPEDCELAENFNNQAIASGKRIMDDATDKKIEEALITAKEILIKMNDKDMIDEIHYFGCGVFHIDCRNTNRLEDLLFLIRDIAAQVDPNLILRESTLEPDSNNMRLVIIEYKQATEQEGEEHA
ncbi:MAG: hypothetical protein WCT26_03605 [Candidatus Buchananbacteria bacterium]|jgi:hypothetical protein